MFCVKPPHSGKHCFLLRLFRWTKKKKKIPSLKTCTHCRGEVLAREKAWGRAVKRKLLLLCLTKCSMQRQRHPTRGSCNLSRAASSVVWAKKQALLLSTLLLFADLEAKKSLPFLLQVTGSCIISGKWHAFPRDVQFPLWSVHFHPPVATTACLWWPGQ